MFVFVSYIVNVVVIVIQVIFNVYVYVVRQVVQSLQGDSVVFGVVGIVSYVQFVGSGKLVGVNRVYSVDVVMIINVFVSLVLIGQGQSVQIDCVVQVVGVFVVWVVGIVVGVYGYSYFNVVYCVGSSQLVWVGFVSVFVRQGCVVQVIVDLYGCVQSQVIERWGGVLNQVVFVSFVVVIEVVGSEFVEVGNFVDGVFVGRVVRINLDLIEVVVFDIDVSFIDVFQIGFMVFVVSCQVFKFQFEEIGDVWGDFVVVFNIDGRIVVSVFQIVFIVFYVGMVNNVLDVIVNFWYGIYVCGQFRSIFYSQCGVREGCGCNS